MLVQIACVWGVLLSHYHARQKQESENAPPIGNLHTSLQPASGYYVRGYITIAHGLPGVGAANRKNRTARRVSGNLSWTVV
jgi:hypothetical protein